MDQSTVVRCKHDDRFVGEFQTIQRRDHCPDRSINTLHHGRILGIAMPVRGCDFRPVLLDQIPSPLDRGVHRVVCQVQKETLSLPSLNHTHSLLGQHFGEILAAGALGWRKVGDSCNGTVFLSRTAIGPEITARSAPLVSSNIHVESVTFRKEPGNDIRVIRSRGQVPLADVSRLVPPLPQCFGQGGVAVFQVLSPLGRPETVFFSLSRWQALPHTIDPVGQVKPRRILARHQCRPRRRADRTCRIRVGKTHSGRGQPVDVRCLVEIAAITAEVGPPQVVNEKDDHVGRLRRRPHGHQSEPHHNTQYRARHHFPLDIRPANRLLKNVLATSSVTLSPEWSRLAVMSAF